MHQTSARLLRLLALLQARRFWAGADLAERLGVTKRTVRRDVDRLRALGYPVESSAGVAGGYQLGMGATLPPLLLDDDEALAVALGLQTAAAGTVTGVEEAALSALGKLQRMLPRRLHVRFEAMRSAVAPLYFAGRQVDAGTLVPLASACHDRREVRFCYRDRQGIASDRIVEPHGLVHTGARWYLVAWDCDRAAWRTFRVDRIEGQPEEGQRFVPRPVPGGDTAAFVSRSVASSPYAIRARVVIHAPVERVAEQVPPLAGFLRPVSDDRCLLESGGHSLGMLALHIAALGEEFEIEEPPELVRYVQVLAARLTRAAARSICAQ